MTEEKKTEQKKREQITNEIGFSFLRMSKNRLASTKRIAQCVFIHKNFIRNGEIGWRAHAHTHGSQCCRRRLTMPQSATVLTDFCCWRCCYMSGFYVHIIYICIPITL